MIRSIIFDLGHVLVDVNYERFQKKIYESGVDEKKYMDFFKGANYRLLGYESGEITTEEFTRKCIEGLGLKLNEKEFADSFNDMFTEITPMKEVLLNLADEEKYNLFLLSNTSPLHFEYIKENFHFVNRLHKFGLSYELKSLKPEDVIYERAIEHLGVVPEESVFIDDLKVNCEAAEKFGIKTICYDKHNHNDFQDKFNKIVSDNK